MNSIIIGNIIALVASIIMMYTGTIKNKKKIIFTQTIQIALSVISNIVLGGITGAIINGLSCIRNILCYKDKLNKFAKAILIVLATSLSLYFNNLGIIGFLPVISTIAYTLFMDLKDVIKYKYLVIFTMVMWFSYDLYIKSFTAACFDFFTIVTNVVAIIQLRKKANV